MAKRKLIAIGDATTHGGTVMPFLKDRQMTADARYVACVGDVVYCPKHPGTQYILGNLAAQSGVDDQELRLDGKKVAYEGDMTTCGARLVSMGKFVAIKEKEMADGCTEYSVEYDLTEGTGTEKEGFVAIAINRAGIGQVSVMLGKGDDENRLMYEPCGSYAKEGLSRRNNDVFMFDEFDPESYYEHSIKHGYALQLCPFYITKEDEDEIRKRIFDADGIDSCIMNSAVRSCWVLKGIGPFKDLEIVSTPQAMERLIEAIKENKKPTL